MPHEECEKVKEIHKDLYSKDGVFTHIALMHQDMKYIKYAVTAILVPIALASIFTAGKWGIDTLREAEKRIIYPASAQEYNVVDSNKI
jgi:hypothetical protein